MVSSKSNTLSMSHIFCNRSGLLSSVQFKFRRSLRYFPTTSDRIATLEGIHGWNDNISRHTFFLLYRKSLGIGETGVPW